MPRGINFDDAQRVSLRTTYLIRGKKPEQIYRCSHIPSRDIVSPIVDCLIKLGKPYHLGKIAGEDLELGKRKEQSDCSCPVVVVDRPQGNFVMQGNYH
jgi:hypothetical protein